MRRIDMAVAGVALLDGEVYGDLRGRFFEGYNKADFAQLGIETEFVQDNYSWSSDGIVRGLHYQVTNQQAKLVRVLHGSIFDVALDVRRDSPTFGKYATQWLLGEDNSAIYIPAGFAHGFCALEPDTLVAYKCSAHYDPKGERGIRWDDPDLDIPWPVMNCRVSEKDDRWPTLAAAYDSDLPASS